MREAHLYRFQYTALTSRTTVYLLLLFWCFFFFAGEGLLLIVLNYNTLTDLIPSGFFTFTKSHVIYMTSSSNLMLGDSIFFFILFFSITAAAFLLNLRYTHTYRYTQSASFLDLIVVSGVLYFFHPCFMLMPIIILLAKHLRLLLI